MAKDWNEFLGTTSEWPAPSSPVASVEAASPTPDKRLQRPSTREELREWCNRNLAVHLPMKAVCPGHDTPLDYLDYVFFDRGPADPVVWACRGGGKTLVAAIATLLDMIFRPGIDIRILGGSAVQTERMYEHLVRFVETGFRDLMIRGSKLGRITKSGFTFGNGSRVELLSQSEGSVRGARVQRVRCDEVDLFDPKVWEAVQLATRSKSGTSGVVRGTIEAFSTMNGPGGLMSKLVADGKRKVFTWCAWDVIEKCTAECKGCSLYGDCRGKAHGAEGFVPVSDLITMHARVQKRTWRYEVLCNPVDGVSAGSGVMVRHY
ncbi:MAG TPA: hypothetical protein VGN88_00490 [Phycisphaerae bacterium]|jgi:hypothetical protein